ncbi:hypothetical protein JKF63_03436 [Porcisia hertigi]|uniref:Leishmanolysin n=1 Tax=Porcisia hertigi TaxID=2761500 RepID=A0A836L6N9_9TRYP|nr:hypothetical protein JKF63_03436 [Porcisia hertigi]
MSRCLDTSGGFSVQGKHQRQYGICADVLCENSFYAVKVAGASSFTLCWPGMALPLELMSSLFTEGTLLCPSYDSVCDVKVDAALYGKYAALLADHSVGGVRAITMAVGPVAALLAVLLTA